MTAEILIDRTSVEVFVDDGKFSLISPRKKSLNNAGFEFFTSKENPMAIRSLVIYKLKSIWP